MDKGFFLCPFVCYAMSFLLYFQYARIMPININARLVSRYLPLIATFVAIWAASAKPKGVMCFKNSTSSVKFAMIFKKYITAARPRPIPRPPFFRKADIPNVRMSTILN